MTLTPLSTSAAAPRAVASLVDTPYGSVLVVANERGVVAVDPLVLEGLELHSALGQASGPAVGAETSLPPAAAPAVAALKAGATTLDGVDTASLTPFQRQVLAEVAAIPAGETRTYAEVAEAVGRPRAARAVGGVMARNPVPLLVPCHRVVGANGSLGGYAFGLDVKRAVLAAEGAPGPARR